MSGITEYYVSNFLSFWQSRSHFFGRYNLTDLAVIREYELSSTMDHFYSVNGRIASTFEVIDMVAERSRLQALVAVPKLQKQMNSTTLLRENQINCRYHETKENIHYNFPIHSEIKQIIIGDRLAYIKKSSEWKRINLFKYFSVNQTPDASFRILCNTLPTIQHSPCCVPGCTQQKILRNNVVYKSNKPEDADLNINEIINIFCENINDKKDYLISKFFEHNFWFKMFYYLQNSKNVSPQLRVSLTQAMGEKNFFEKLKLFGYDMSILENKKVDEYSFKLLQDVCRSHKINLEKNNMQVSMAVDFVGSRFADGIIKACDENYYYTSRPRMDYTKQF